EQLHKTYEQIPKINDTQLYNKFLYIINLILGYCQKLKLSQGNKVIQKYKKLKLEINESSDPNKNVIDHSVKFSKYKFIPQLYDSELLFLLIKLEYFYFTSSPNKQDFKSNNKTSVLLENLPNWIQQNYVKEIKKSIEVYEDEENISIDNDNFTQIIRERIYGINKSTNEKKFIIELAEKFSPFSKKFDLINYRFKPKLIPYIKWFENCLIKIAKQRGSDTTTPPFFYTKAWLGARTFLT
ncbi:24450_t:CDS:2, partial [Gigaspora margarita]